jgi:FkbM family methyltransferase
MLRFLLQPGAVSRGAPYVERCEEIDDWLKVFLKGCADPIFWPKEDDVSILKVIIGEQFHPNDWHRYLIPETSVGAGDVVVDCGAAEGLFTFLTQSVAKKVYAVEPMPRFQEAMRHTFAARPNVEIVPLALGSESGQAQLVCRSVCSNIRGIGSLPGEETVTVDVVTLDSLYAGQTIDFLKADIEGLEIDVIKGGQELIHRSKPRLAITTYHEPSHAEELKQLLRRIHPGYRIKCKGASVHGTALMLHAWT